MSKHNLPDERVVYLKLKEVFKGSHAEVRQPKVITKLIKQNRNQEDIAELIRAHNLDIICNTARSLLTEEIFESTLKAKIRFPELFDVSPAQTAERAASEFEAARNDANAIRDARSHQFENSVESLGTVETIEQNSVVETLKVPTRETNRKSLVLPALFPVYLPLRTQHHLLTKMQTILESACFTFGQHNLPEVIHKNGWDCSESAELNLWATEFGRHQSIFAARENHSGKSLEKLFRSMADIRHAAVHRIRMSAKGLQLFLADAESFTILLDNAECQQSLTKLRQKTQLTVEELERSKHILNSKLDETLKDISLRRAELDRLEARAMEEIMKDDGDYQALAGTNLEAAILIHDIIVQAPSSRDTDIQSGVEDNDSTGD